MKKNITNDIDLYNYLLENNIVKNNIFTSLNKMKENYINQAMLSFLLPTFIKVNGDYQGNIFYELSSWRAIIPYNNKNYIFYYGGLKEYKEEDSKLLEELLESLIIS